MSHIGHILLIGLLSIACYQDIKYRAISWLVFPGVLISSLIIKLLSENMLFNIFMNLTFLTVVLGTLFVYISIKRKHLTNILKEDLGIGDILFFIAITPLFLDRNYILFFITGMLLSGLIHLSLIPLKVNPKIPLAGYLSLYLMVLLVLDQFSNWELFSSNIL
jgi:Flp pilus assembly protein protease CpaA